MQRASKPGQKKSGGRAASAKRPSLDIPVSLNVRQLADMMRISPIDVIKQLMRNGVMANINHVIDYELAATIANDFGYETRQKKVKAKAISATKEIKKKLEGQKSANVQPRPPVVTIMGHVDHGKTKLLDAIRKTNVVDTEAGGITQHIGAYQVEVEGQKITFLDTPGHEAFTAMRARGAQVTDIAILVVAADDGVMPQTLEAIDHAKAAGVPIVVALNKIDKENANPEHTIQQLAEAGLVVEDWGGDIVCVPVSAKEKKGIEELLENLLLVAEMEELVADPSTRAAGIVIEAEMDKFRGPLATVLVQNGTLRVSDIIVAGFASGKVKAMFSETGKQVRKAGPSSPVEILGFDEVPQVGDILNVVSSESRARELIENRRQASAQKQRGIRLDSLYDKISAGEVKELNVVLKTDVQGSIEPIRASLEKLGTEEVQVRIIHSGAGNVTEGDVMLALASNGLIISFGTGIESNAQRMADVRDVDVRKYSVIYNLIEDVEKALKGLLEPTITEIIDGRAEVREIFKSRKGKVAGLYVTEGKITRNSNARVVRAGEILSDSIVTSLKRFKDDVREVNAGYECGIGIKDFTDFEVGDVVECFHIQKVIEG